MAKPKRILVAPLDWGLGHAARSIPVIQTLLECGQEVMMASSGDSLSLLKKEFPQLQHFDLPGYKVSYSKNGSLPFSMLLQAPKIMVAILKEHAMVKKIISEHQIDAVISDNRFGLWVKNVPTVFITHQVHLKSSPRWALTGSALNRINRYYISRFQECWIPDTEYRELSGDLSQPFLGHNMMYVGPVSRFKNEEAHEQHYSYDLVIVLSGPEPQRTILENILIGQVRTFAGKVLLIRGKPVNGELKSRQLLSQNLTIVPYLSSHELRNALLSARHIVSRSGYSSIMDYAALGKDAILVPTPGQTEQEYLASRLKEKKVFYSMPQETFELSEAISQAKNYSVKNIIARNVTDLKTHISDWLERIG